MTKKEHRNMRIQSAFEEIFCLCSHPIIILSNRDNISGLKKRKDLRGLV